MIKIDLNYFFKIMKRISAVILVLFIAYSCSSLGQQSYASHVVKDGDTASSIANQYKITIYELYKLNPEVRENLYPGMVLILPGNKNVLKAEKEEVAHEAFITHKVKRGETIFRLSQDYNVPVDILKKYNKQLYADELKTGDQIRIPRNYKNLAKEEEVEDPSVETSTNRKHVVQPKETKYGLAAMYGITIAELEELNPEIKDGLPIGTILNVPDVSFTKDAKIDEESFGFYEVKPQENIFRLTQRWNITEEKLLELNPALVEGLKAGMVLKVPKPIMQIEVDDFSGEGITDLRKHLVDFSPKNVALMLPFNINKTEADSLDIREDVLKSDRVMRIALDFYSGVLAAVDSAKAMGLSTNVYVYDTKYVYSDQALVNSKKVDQLFRDHDFSDMDVVIGPLVGSNVEAASRSLRPLKVPLISPITPKIDLHNNVFQSRPTERVLHKKMLEYITLVGSNKNLIVVADGENIGMRDTIKNIFPSAKIVNPRKGKNGYYLALGDVIGQLEDQKENWVILETNKIPLISNVITNLETQVDFKKITLMTTFKGSAYNSNDIGHLSLMKLNFHFPSVDLQKDALDNKGFSSAYEKEYGVPPSDYAVRGYDVTLDTLLRLASAENLYDSAEKGYVTHYVENKFDYVRELPEGFYNRAVYVLKYTKDLEFEEVKVPTQVIDKLKTITD